MYFYSLKLSNYCLLIEIYFLKIQFPVSNNMDHGLSLESGVYISHIAPGSQAAKEGSLAVGDRILTVSS